MGELETLMGEYFSEEAQEPEHQGDEEVMPISDTEMSGEEKEKKHSKDSEIVRAEPKLAPGDVPQSQLDAAALDGQLAMLNNLRPMIVASGDSIAAKFFNEQLGSVMAARKSGGTPGSSYSMIRKAAGTLSAGATDSKANAEKTAAQKAEEWNAMYAAERAKRSSRKKTAA